MGAKGRVISKVAIVMSTYNLNYKVLITRLTVIPIDPFKDPFKEPFKEPLKTHDPLSP